MAIDDTVNGPGSRLGGASPEGPDASHEHWPTKVTRIGQAGLQLNKALNALDVLELSRMTNLYHTQDGQLTSRYGQTAYATSVGADVHTIGRLNDPQNASFTHIWGIDTGLFRGASGATALVDNGYSGKPLSMVPWRPTLSNGTWMVVADGNKMSIVPTSGAVLPLGLAAPSVAGVAALAAKQILKVCDFNVSDGTNAATWTGYGGQDRSVPPVPIVGSPTIVDSEATPEGNQGVAIQTVNTNAMLGYSNWISRSIGPLDLTTFGDGAKSSDDDVMHLWVHCIRGNHIEEIRVYLICSPGFAPAGNLPGTSIGPAGVEVVGDPPNSDAFVKSFSQADIQSYLSQNLGAQTTAQGVAAAEARRQFLEQSGNLHIFSDTNNPQVITNPFDSTVIEPPSIPPGTTWGEFGVIGLPVRRGDFVRIGNTPNTGWNSISGVMVYVQTSDNFNVQVDVQGLYLTGGYAPDVSDPADTPYDYRYTYYDPRTGTEGNPSPIMLGAPGATAVTPVNTVNPLRQKVTLTPTPASDANLLERWYRRGGTLPSDWFFLGTSASHGAAFTDTFSDASIVTAGSVALDHDQPITTVNAAGATVLNQPLNALWGPTQNGYIFGCGDPFRPGYLYWPIPGEPGHWPAANSVEVCAPSEQLMNGVVWGGQAYVFSMEALYVIYPNFDGSGAVTTNSTGCKHGLAVRQALCATSFGIAFVSRDAVRLTTGGATESISENIRQLFHGKAVNGYQPIDILNHPDDIKLSFYDNELWFIYRDTAGTMQCLIYHLVYKYWRPYVFNNLVSCVFGETQQGLAVNGQTGISLILGAKFNGKAYTYTGFTDDSVGIPFLARTGAWDGGQARMEKQFGDFVVFADMQGANLTGQTFLNTEQITNASQAVAGQTGKRWYLFDAFGTGPQKARSITIELSGTAPSTAQVALEYLGVSEIPQPDITMNRATNWDQLETASEKYLIGVQIEADSFGNTIPLIVEYDLNGVVVTAASFNFNTNGRHKQRFTWPVVKADLVRIRPNGACQAWQLYRLDWIAQAEPPRIAGWDTNWENLGDAYITGIDLECDTFGQNKTVQLYIDQVLIQTFTVNANGRKNLALTVNSAVPAPGPIRGRVFRLVATDANPGLLYSWKWIAEKEPGLQTNWNQNITIAGGLRDKYLKGVLLQSDTFNQVKSVQIEVDGVVGPTFTVQTSGRSVTEVTFPQVLGRAFRLYPTDGNAGRLYSLQWIFDDEPLALSRWETQETDHLVHGWQSVLWTNFTYKTTDANAVTLTVNIYGDTGTVIATQVYTLPATAGLKVKKWVPFSANKGVLYKYVFTCPAPFWLYREESQVMVKPWGGDEALLKRPWGNDDLDPSRGMGNASLAAAHSGGEAE